MNDAFIYFNRCPAEIINKLTGYTHQDSTIPNFTIESTETIQLKTVLIQISWLLKPADLDLQCFQYMTHDIYKSEEQRLAIPANNKRQTGIQLNTLSLLAYFTG